MDPNETLRLLRAWAARALESPESDSERNAALRFNALDLWVSQNWISPMSQATHPNEHLRELRAWAKRAIETADVGSEDDAAELFDALDNWLSKGGFKPEAWTK